MKEAQPQAIHLADYRVPEFLIDSTELMVRILDDRTEVTSKLAVRRNPESTAAGSVLTLSGGNLDTQSISVNGQQLSAGEYTEEPGHLVISKVSDQFELEIMVFISPETNTSLEGFYQSGTMYCTQCEAEGFRNITWYLDRPDVLSVFTTRLEADKSAFPVLLSNGNPVESGDLENGRHYATWHDPFPKPAYLFAMVAGELVRSDSEFVTRSGRKVSCQLFVEKHNSDKTDFAHGALHRSMKWDEERFGREYDLDIYMIVASDYFNMGAMENKGLNVFNSARVLATPDTTTDSQFTDIEAVIGHEYFHNWSGNRVTCRDWFQLSLKEGFTVFRDSEFTADLHSRSVKRLDDVTMLRTMQFSEDASAMSHPVRPQSYIEINNFYTMTIYEKGAEVVRMIQTLLGEEIFRKGSDLYFERHDGQAATIEDFVAAMAEVSGFDFSQFMLWYDQAGTPLIDVQDKYLADAGEYHLTFRQQLAPTPGQPDKLPMLIPVKMGLVGSEGQDLAINVEPAEAWNPETKVLTLTEAEQTFVFRNIKAKPVPSLLRDFSAPVRLDFDYNTDELAFLMAKDSNLFNRWDASQRLATNVLLANITRAHAGEAMELPDEYVTALQNLIRDQNTDRAVLARMLQLPSENLLFERMTVADVDAIHQARQFVRVQIATALKKELEAWYQLLDDGRVYEFTAQDVADRALKNLCLSYLTALEWPETIELAWQQYRAGSNFTDVAAAMSALSQVSDDNVHQDLYADFISRWEHDSLMVEHWLATQSASATTTVTDIKALMESEHFNLRNPNRVRAVLGRFIMANLTQFHKSNGSGYKFMADQILVLDLLNPQIAGRICSGFRSLPKLDASRQSLMRVQLQRIIETEGLSPDVYENVARILKG